MKDKIKNTLLGIAIGDAFGAGIEFQDRNWILNNVDFTKYLNARGPKYGKNYIPGHYTDDTEHSIGIINTLISKKPFTEQLLLDEWKKEYFQDKKQKGYGRQGHGSIRWYYEGEKDIEDIRSFQAKRYSPGNAPPMRAVPLGFINDSLINKYAIINADSTHPHPKGRAASIIVARAAEFLLMKNGKREDLIDYCLEHIKGIDKEMEQSIPKIKKLPHPDLFKNEFYRFLCGPQPLKRPIPGIMGMPSDSMYTAYCTLHILSRTENAFEGLRYAMQLGGDVDSIGSIVTGILGGRYGLDSLPKFMLEQVEGRERLEKLAEDFNSYLN
ncbi:ADP-ribosylglycohydrolase family protein [Nanoarchaeota archaeon]